MKHKIKLTSNIKSYLKGLSSVVEGWAAMLGEPIETKMPMSDEEAFASDWEAIGDDMRDAIKIVMADDIVDSFNRKSRKFEQKMENKLKRWRSL